MSRYLSEEEPKGKPTIAPEEAKIILGFDPAYQKDKSVLVEMRRNQDGDIVVTNEHVSHFVGYGYILDDEETRTRKLNWALVQIHDNAPAGQKRVYVKKHGGLWKGPVFVKADQVELTA